MRNMRDNIFYLKTNVLQDFHVCVSVDLKFCIIFNMISFVNIQASVKFRLACSKTLLLTISSSNIVTHSNGYI